MKYYLCSASPRRRELLKLLIPDFDVLASGAEEKCPAGLSHAETTVFLARQKLPEKRDPGAVYISADTTVSAECGLLGKPANREDAIKMLSSLSGKKHTVITGVATDFGSRVITGHAETKVYFSPLTREEIEWYVSTGEPMDKAGAYAIQGLGARFIEKIEGDYFNVVGLPVNLLYNMLSANSLLQIKG